MRLTTTCKFLGSLAALVCAVLATQANGEIFVAEDFAYADGSDLVGNTPPIGGTWAAFNGAGVTSVEVANETISLLQGGGTREDVNVPFEGGAVMGAGDVFYSGFHLTVPNPGATITPTYFAMFLTGTSFFDARVWVTTPTSSGFRLAISNDNSITDNDGEVFSTDLVFGQTYRIVTKYDFTAKDSALWIDPIDESSPSISPSDPGFSDAAFSYAFRQATGNTSQIIDNLKVADNFAEAIPEPASVALMLLAGLGMVSCLRGRSIQ